MSQDELIERLQYYIDVYILQGNAIRIIETIDNDAITGYVDLNKEIVKNKLNEFLDSIQTDGYATPVDDAECSGLLSFLNAMDVVDGNIPEFTELSKNRDMIKDILNVSNDDAGDPGAPAPGTPGDP